MTHLLVALAAFRLLQSLLFVPLLYFFLKRVSFKTLFFVALVLQATTFISFAFGHKSIFLLGLVSVLFAAYDGFYYTLRKDLERITPHEKDIAKGIGYSRSLEIGAEALGIILVAYGTHFAPILTFSLVSFFLLLSFVPIAIISIPAQNISKEKNFSEMILFEKSIWKFINTPAIWIIITASFVSEMIFAFPSFLADLQIDSIKIGWIIALMRGVTFLSFLLIGFFENKNKRVLLRIFGMLTAGLFLSFVFISPQYWGYFLLLYGFIGESWEVGGTTLRQRFVHKNLSPLEGGVFDQWIDNTARALFYPVFFGIALITSTKFAVSLKIFFVFAAMIAIASLFAISKTRKALEGSKLKSSILKGSIYQSFTDISVKF